MTTQITFTVYGPPVPKARARVGKNGGYTPAKTATYETVVKHHAMAARCKMSKWPWQDKNAGFGVSLKVYRSGNKGDFDNYLKSMLDAGNGVLWPDDKQVIRLNDSGVWQVKPGAERIEVSVWIVEANQ